MESSPQEETLDRLLADYRQNGVDSEGVFTLNPARAREMLEQFQLPEPAYSALHLTSFLIGAGASSVRVGLQAGGLILCGVDATVPEDVVASPFSALLKSRAEPYLSELALGLNAILGQQATAQMTCQGKTAHYSSDRINVVEGPTGPDLTLKVSTGGERELQLIAEHFSLCPIPIFLSGRGVAGAEVWSKATLQVCLENPAYPLPDLPDVALNVRKFTAARFSAVVRLGRQSSGVRVLHLGRLYGAALPWRSGLEGWHVEVLLNTDRLQKDLTQQFLRENEKFKNIFATLQQQLEQALLDLPMSVWQDDDAQALWDDVVTWLSGDRIEQAVARQVALARALDTMPGLGKANALKRLGLLQSLLRTGSGAASLQTAESILEKADSWQAKRVSVRARMDLSRPTPELEKTVSAWSNDARASGQDKLEALRWLRHFRSESAHLRTQYTCRIAQQLYSLRRPALALQELDSLDAVSVSPKGVVALVFEIKAAALADLGHYGKAAESLGQLLDIQREEYGQYDSRLGLTLTRMAALLDHLGKGKQAREYHEWSQRLQD